MNADDIERAIFDAANALRVPVLIAALAALAFVVVELGRVCAEGWRRRHRDLHRLSNMANSARHMLELGDVDGARAALEPAVVSQATDQALNDLLRPRDADYDDWSAKTLADFDYASLRRLERTRILVRFGPALGLMGTLIPLSPALAALSKGDTTKLAENLRIAFSVTVLGLLVGAVAFAISLIRDRLYSQDLSDLEYLAASIGPALETRAAVGGAPQEVTS
jgi:biopolymer transport protein ExbB/TolQ